ncbi:MAG TPA: transcriptional repressor [Actinomycetota bacterium]|nr:transcriptional repressor [Actinomycetota bacterium]
MSDRIPHAEVSERLSRAQQRYTAGRRALVELLHGAGRPVGIAEILETPSRLPQSSIYRNLVVLEQVGAVTRYPGAGGSAHYELSEELVGHHDHLVCTTCGRMEDYDVPPEIEGDLLATMDAIAASKGFRATGHRLELRGRCASCA